MRGAPRPLACPVLGLQVLPAMPQKLSGREQEVLPALGAVVGPLQDRHLRGALGRCILSP